MAVEIPAERLAEYRATLAAREERRRLAVAERRERALTVAAEAARLLRGRFGATRVLLFGSLAAGDWFGEHSDIDLAAEGLPFDAYFRAVAVLQDVGGEFSIDLVDLDSCPDALAARVREEGALL